MQRLHLPHLRFAPYKSDAWCKALLDEATYVPPDPAAMDFAALLAVMRTIGMRPGSGAGLRAPGDAGGASAPATGAPGHRPRRVGESAPAGVMALDGRRELATVATRRGFPGET